MRLPNWNIKGRWTKILGYQIGQKVKFTNGLKGTGTIISIREVNGSFFYIIQLHDGTAWEYMEESFKPS